MENPDAADCSGSSSTPRWPTPRRGGERRSNGSCTTCAGCQTDLDPCTRSSRPQVAAIRRRVGAGKVVCGLSGGVDSAVAAALVHRGGRRPAHLRVRRHGLLAQASRAGGGDVSASFQIELIHVNAADRFLRAPAGVTDPEEKRKPSARPSSGVRGRAADRARRTVPVPGHAVPGRDRVGHGGTRRRSRATTTWAGCPPTWTSSWSNRCGACSKTRCGPRRGAGPARGDRLAPALPRPGTGGAHHRGGHPPERWSCSARADAIVREEIRRAGLETGDLAGVRGAPGHPHASG
ncbi:MAG: hypothetical protein KatS3mg011_0376 [Acidimicrobiia bacterium]|nr:MAG: hypothetical protein KatS3mg011_0376 [Acidimicrobiia bacterium]